MVVWPVSPRVGNVKNNDTSLIERLVSAGQESGTRQTAEPS
jgi:hypothetical protein